MVSVTHQKTSAAPATSNPAEIGGPDWNAGHNVDLGTILNAIAVMANVGLVREYLAVDNFTARGDADYSVQVGDGVVGVTQALTAPRTWTLPSPASVTKGRCIVITDFTPGGGLTTVNSLTVSGAGLSGPQSWVLSAPGASAVFRSDGVSAWVGETTSDAKLAGLLDAKVNKAGDTMTGQLRLPLGPQSTSGMRFGSDVRVYSAAQRLHTSYSGKRVGTLAHARDAILANHVLGAPWLIGASAADNDWTSVCWSPQLGLFVAVASSGTGNRVMTSPDGFVWTARTSAADNNWTSVCWSPERGLFVAVASSGTGNRVMTSPDGVTWTARASAADNNWTSVCWSPDLFVFVAVASSGTGNRVMTSANGINWVARASAANNEWRSVAWSEEDRQFCAIASTGSDRAMQSTDGIAWVAQGGFNDALHSICHAPHITGFYGVGPGAAGFNNTNFWQGVVGEPAGDWQSICWAAELGQLIAVANGGVSGTRIMTSPDGTNWTYRNSPADNAWSSVCWSPELSLAVAVASSGTGNRVMTSTPVRRFPLASSVDEALVRFNGALGAVQSNSFGFVDDEGGFSSVQQFSVADDAVASFNVPGNNGATVIIADFSFTSPRLQGIFYVRANSTPNALNISLASASSVTFTNGVLTGTTGTDGNITVSGATDGKLYIENRSGAAHTFAMLFVTR